MALVGANALLLLVGLIWLLVPVNEYSNWTLQANAAFDNFVGLQAAVLPLLAVLLATHVQPVLSQAKLITQVALGEYAFGALLGVITFLIATIGQLVDGEGSRALLTLLAGTAYLAIFGVAARVVHRVWRTLYYVPKPKPEPGVYGRPQPGPQSGYPGYASSQQPYGQPYGAGMPGQPPYAPPQSASSSGPVVPQPPVQPVSSSAEATQVVPRATGPAQVTPQSAEPTQAIPRPNQDGGERTQKINPPD